ncbi:MAG: hypothetical protein RBT33_00850 [Candidatus Dojkabacteria bacterium]|jgi:hypothetical protein|nr:hypothetical protein [Candidatus Dojkabacteria bacterium]MDX9738901.1 hypothetical protein [Candidatus Dojkabacteria bacterium]
MAVGDNLTGWAAVGFGAGGGYEKRRQLQEEAVALEAAKSGLERDGKGGFKPMTGTDDDIMRQLIETRNELNNLKIQNTQYMFGNVLEDYAKNGSTENINKFIQNNPGIKKAFSSIGVESVVSLNLEDPAHLAALRRSGLDDEQITSINTMDAEELTDFRKAYPLYMGPNGLNVGSFEDALSMSGALKSMYATDKMDMLLEVSAKGKNALIKAMSPREQQLVNEGQQAINKGRELTNTGLNIANDQAATELTLLKKWMAKNPNANIEDFLTIKTTGGKKSVLQQNYEYLEGIQPGLGKDFINAQIHGKETTTGKDIATAEQIADDILISHPDYYETAYTTDHPEYSKVYSEIYPLISATKTKLSATDRKEIGKFERMATDFGKASKLNDQDVGLLNSLFTDIDQFISGSKSNEAKAAYSQVMTGVRNSLYGATLPAAEMRDFSRAYGSLYMADKAVAVKLKTAIEGQLSELQALKRSIGHPIIGHFMLGAAEQKFKNTLKAMDTKNTSNVVKPSKGEVVGNNNNKNPREGTRAINPDTGEVLIYSNGKWVSQ